MSTYLLAFTVSNFENLTSIGNPQYSVYASSKEYKNMEFALNISRSALKALEEYTILSYPLNKMDFIAIDDFLYGAMVSDWLTFIEWMCLWTIWNVHCEKIMETEHRKKIFSLWLFFVYFHSPISASFLFIVGELGTYQLQVSPIFFPYIFYELNFFEQKFFHCDIVPLWNCNRKWKSWI